MSTCRGPLAGIALAAAIVLALSLPRAAERWAASSEFATTTVIRSDRVYAPRCATDPVGAVIRLAEAGHG